MPAEWESHAATWLAWPHEKSDWPGKFAPIPWVYADIVRHLDPRDQEYFRQSRAQRFGMTIEQLCANRDARVGAFRQTLEPLRTTLKSQAFLCGLE